MTASPLQLAQAYSVFANEGYLKDFRLYIDNLDNLYQQRVISRDTADDVLDSLKLVVSDGTKSCKNIKF